MRLQRFQFFVQQLGIAYTRFLAAVNVIGGTMQPRDAETEMQKQTRDVETN